MGLSNWSMISHDITRPLGYERVYLPLYKGADTPFHIQGDELCRVTVSGANAITFSVFL